MVSAEGLWSTWANFLAIILRTFPHRLWAPVVYLLSGRINHLPEIVLQLFQLCVALSLTWAAVDGEEEAPSNAHAVSIHESHTKQGCNGSIHRWSSSFEDVPVQQKGRWHVTMSQLPVSSACTMSEQLWQILWGTFIHTPPMCSSGSSELLSPERTEPQCSMCTPDQPSLETHPKHCPKQWDVTEYMWGQKFHTHSLHCHKKWQFSEEP